MASVCQCRSNHKIHLTHLRGFVKDKVWVLLAQGLNCWRCGPAVRMAGRVGGVAGVGSESRRLIGIVRQDSGYVANDASGATAREIIAGGGDHWLMALVREKQSIWQ